MTDAYTPIHNDVLEALMLQDISGAEARVIMAIWRKTYGFANGQIERKKYAYLGVLQLMKMTNLSERSVQRSLKKLSELKIIIRSGAKTGFCKEFMRKSDKSAGVISAGVKNVGGGVKNVGSGDKSGTNKRNYIKKPVKEIPTEAVFVDDTNQGLGKKPPTSYSNKSYSNETFPLEDYRAVIAHVAKVQGVKTLGNYPKQTSILKRMFEDGWTVDELKEAATKMSEDEYWGGVAFDLANVSNNVHKYTKKLKRPKLLAEQEMALQFETPEWQAQFEEARKIQKERGLRE